MSSSNTTKEMIISEEKKDDAINEIRWHGVPLDVEDILQENVPQFIKNNKIRSRYGDKPYEYHHIVVIGNTYTAYVPSVDGELSMTEFKKLKYDNDYL